MGAEKDSRPLFLALSERTGAPLVRTPEARAGGGPYYRFMNDARIAITGGTSGLGLALVREALRRGAHVAFVARTRERVEAVARAHPGAYGIVGDVARKEDIYPMALQIAGNLGGLDVLVNNASEPRSNAAGATRRYRGVRTSSWRWPRTCSVRSA